MMLTLTKLTVVQLKGLLKLLQLSTKGKKAELISRLEETKQFKPIPSSTTSSINTHKKALEDLLKECENKTGILVVFYLGVNLP